MSLFSNPQKPMLHGEHMNALDGIISHPQDKKQRDMEGVNPQTQETSFGHNFNPGQSITTVQK
ncbi:hypothetical protein GJ744_002965 [Endocarpon pusillum]|uniref:Uncharacterized protein n=1 Tax=Endocarpon pusillum TaxID=364733 RepID=A0A8H7A794_9EURO|nr:hypothetical protein GJ744_002965 [Endocarpon pusillum]